MEMLLNIDQNADAVPELMGWIRVGSVVLKHEVREPEGSDSFSYKGFIK